MDYEVATEIATLENINLGLLDYNEVLLGFEAEFGGQIFTEYKDLSDRIKKINENLTESSKYYSKLDQFNKIWATTSLENKEKILKALNLDVANANKPQEFFATDTRQTILDSDIIDQITKTPISDE